MIKIFFISLIIAVASSSAFAADVIKNPEVFVSESFAGNPPASEVFKIEKSHKKRMGKIMKRRIHIGQIKYWMNDEKSVWVLEEVGKTKPITTGFIIKGDKIESVQILVYRESHGFEVKYPFFTDQFKEVALDENYRLNKSIDSISGATLSVSALKKLATLALYLHKTVKDKQSENNG